MCSLLVISLFDVQDKPPGETYFTLFSKCRIIQLPNASVFLFIHTSHIFFLLVSSGKHEEKKDEHGFVSRNFTRKYTWVASLGSQTRARKANKSCWSRWQKKQKKNWPTLEGLYLLRDGRTFLKEPHRKFEVEWVGMWIGDHHLLNHQYLNT